MSLKLLHITPGHLRTMVQLADGGLTPDSVRQTFVEAGWKLPAPESDGDGAETRDGWELEIHVAAPEPASSIVLPFALLWPPIATEDDDLAEDEDEEEEDDLDEDYDELWERRLDAGPSAFTAEFMRVRALLEEMVGPPGEVHGDLTSGARWDVWHRGTTVLALYAQDDVASYSHYDRLAVGVWHTSAWQTPE